MKTLNSALVVAAILLSALPAPAQRQRASPHETVSARINGDYVVITYGRPYTKDPRSGDMRKIWGGLVPYGAPWRMGADEATTIMFGHPMVIGDTTIPAGTYALYFIPDEKGPSHLVFSSNAAKWGIPVDTGHDVAKVEVKQETLDNPVDQFTIGISRGQDGGGVLKWSWEKTAYSVDFKIQK